MLLVIVGGLIFVGWLIVSSLLQQDRDREKAKQRELEYKIAGQRSQAVREQARARAKAMIGAGAMTNDGMKLVTCANGHVHRLGSFWFVEGTTSSSSSHVEHERVDAATYHSYFQVVPDQRVEATVPVVRQESSSNIKRRFGCPTCGSTAFRLEGGTELCDLQPCIYQGYPNQPLHWFRSQGAAGPCPCCLLDRAWLSDAVWR